MITGRFNIVLGLVVMILAGITGFALGLTLDRYFQNGYAQITFWPFGASLLAACVTMIIMVTATQKE